MVRDGAAIAAAVPPYEDLDDLMVPPPGAHTVAPAGAPKGVSAMTAMGGAAGLVDLSLWETDRAACIAQVAEAARQTGFLQALPSRAFSLGVSLQSCRSRASL